MQSYRVRVTFQTTEQKLKANTGICKIQQIAYELGHCALTVAVLEPGSL